MHVEHDLIADARDRDAGTLKLRSEFGFLLIHVAADSRAGEAADARTDERRNTRIRAGRRADDRPRDGAAASADDSAAGRVRDLRIARVGIDGRARAQRQGGDGRDQKLGLHWLPPKVCCPVLAADCGRTVMPVAETAHLFVCALAVWRY